LLSLVGFYNNNKKQQQLQQEYHQDNNGAVSTLYSVLLGVTIETEAGITMYG